MEVDVSISILKVTNLPPSLENKSIFVYLQNSKDHIQGTTVKDGEVDFEKNGTPCFLIRKLLNENSIKIKLKTIKSEADQVKLVFNVLLPYNPRTLDQHIELTIESQNHKAAMKIELYLSQVIQHQQEKLQPAIETTQTIEFQNETQQDFISLNLKNPGNSRRGSIKNKSKSKDQTGSAAGGTRIRSNSLNSVPNYYKKDSTFTMSDKFQETPKHDEKNIDKKKIENNPIKDHQDKYNIPEDSNKVGQKRNKSQTYSSEDKFTDVNLTENSYQPEGFSGNHTILAMHKPNASYNFTDFKIIMVGDSGVGKTSFHNIINTGCVSINTPATTMPAIAVRTFVNENSDVIKINFWDTAGQENYKSQIKLYFRNANGVIIMYDVTNRSSFSSVSKMLTYLKDEEPTLNKAIFLLVANKIDAVITRAVDYEEGIAFAKSKGLAFCEVSAKSGKNCEVAFQILCNGVFNKFYTTSMHQTNSTNIILNQNTSNFRETTSLLSIDKKPNNVPEAQENDDTNYIGSCAC